MKTKKIGRIKLKKEQWIIILAVLLIITAGYIFIDKYTEAKQKEQTVIFQQGMQAGYEQAVVQLIQQAATCQ